MKIQAIPRVSQEQNASPTATAVQQLGDIAATCDEMMKRAGAHLTVNTAPLVQAKSNGPRVQPEEKKSQPAPRADDHATYRSPARNRTKSDDPSASAANRPGEAGSAAKADRPQDPADRPARREGVDGPADDAAASVPASSTDTGDETAVETTVAAAVEATATTAAPTEAVIAAAAADAAATVPTEAPTQPTAGPAKPTADGKPQFAPVEGDVAAPASDGDAKATAPLAADTSHQGKAPGVAAKAADAAVNAAAAGAGSDAAAQQAADLGKRLGAGDRMQVKVTVADTANAVVSEPTSNLSAAAVTAVDPGAQGQNAQTGAHGEAQGGAPQIALAPAATQAALAQALQNADAGSQAAAADSAGAIESVQGTQATSGEQSAASQAAAAANQPGQPASDVQRAARANPVVAARNAAFRQAVVDQVSVNITKAAADGLDHINIQLRPAHLGRIDVQIDMSADGHISAVVTAANKNTLDLLQQDSSSLEKALQDAGFQTDSGSLTFNLRSGNDGQSAGNSSSASSSTPGRDEKSLDELLHPDTYAQPRSDKRIDIRA